MTFAIECVRTGPVGGERFNVAESVWWQLLGLALAHGWLPEGAAPWHHRDGHCADYSAADWLHAKVLSTADAHGFARALRAVAATHALRPIAERFAAYCDGGGFVFARSDTDRQRVATH
jgi:hypothetical protein